ncbi:YkvA family protein [Arthrobacter sp. CP30]
MDRHAALSVVVALVLAYALFLACLAVYARRHPDVLSLTDALRLAPDILRLVRRLAADRALPRRSRLLLLGLLAYLLLPIDLVPDILPVVGYADDLVLIAVVLRAVVRSAGPDALRRHWPGSDGGLRLVRALAGLRDPDEERNTA